MSVRAKFRLTSITEHHWNPTSRTLRFQAEYDQSIPEDRRFYDATPTGSFEMLCNNPSATGQFEIGKAYYIDLTPAE